MHELSICQALLDEAVNIAMQHDARSILSITIRIGPLAGVDHKLLARAFDVARAGTSASDATLKVNIAAVRVECRGCGTQSEVGGGRLRCGSCGEYNVRLIEGDELLLASLELETMEKSDVQ